MRKFGKYVVLLTAFICLSGADARAMTDSEWIETAIRNRKDGVVVIPRRRLATEPERDWWLIDRAILVPDQTVVVLQNCKIKLSDKCRDNFFRSANCGPGQGDPIGYKNIEIRGEGFCVLEGADNPRSTGDSGKKLLSACDWKTYSNNYRVSYGSDAGKPGEAQNGDWRNIGILMANVDGLRISNLRIVNSHSWAISLEACRNARIEKIDFSSNLRYSVNGVDMSVKNQDGIDLRNGCSNVIISDITGYTGDDVIALTAIVSPNSKAGLGGTFDSTHVMHNDFNRRGKDIDNVIIRNIAAYSAGHCAIVRLLPCEARIRNVVIDGVVDTSPDGYHSSNALLLGDADKAYGKCLPESISFLTVNNVISTCETALNIRGYVSHATFSNVVNVNPKSKTLHVARENALKDVTFSR